MGLPGVCAYLCCPKLYVIFGVAWLTTAKSNFQSDDPFVSVSHAVPELGVVPSLTVTSPMQTCFSLSFICLLRWVMSKFDLHIPNTDLFLSFNFMQFLSRVMSEFDHYIPNADLSSLQTVGDVVVFFSTPVRDTTLYEDLSKLDLPPNLHIQMEPVRFDPETDTMFGGVTAFPGRPTVISSLRFRRKYGKKDPE